MRQSELIAALLLLLGTVGCTKEKREAVAGPTTSVGQPTLSSIQDGVFRLSCATSGCHDNRANPAGSLDLSNENASYSNLVNRNSTQAALKIVTPGLPEQSYLINKLLGTHTGVGGNGSSMPQYAASLSSAEVDRIAEWITDGAQKN